MAEDKRYSEKKNNGGVNNRIPDDEEEETYIYDVRKPMEFINEGENGVFDIRKQTGINSAKSVFDRDSVFKTHL